MIRMLALRTFIGFTNIAYYLQFSRNVFQFLANCLCSYELELCRAVRTDKFFIRCIAFNDAYREILKYLDSANFLGFTLKSFRCSLDRFFRFRITLDLNLVEERKLGSSAASP